MVAVRPPPPFISGPPSKMSDVEDMDIVAPSNGAVGKKKKKESLANAKGKKAKKAKYQIQSSESDEEEQTPKVHCKCNPPP